MKRKNSKSAKTSVEEILPFVGKEIVFLDRKHIDTHDEIPNRAIVKAHVDALIKSIKDNGLETPLLVWNCDEQNVDDGEVIRPASFICAGFHRNEAIQKLPEAVYKKVFPQGVPCRVVGGPLKNALEAQLRENLFRQAMSNTETISAIVKLMENHGATSRSIAASVGKSEGYVSQVKSIYESLDQNEWQLLCEGHLAHTEASAIASAVKALKAASTEDEKEAASKNLKSTRAAASKKAASRKATGKKQGDAPKRIGTSTLIKCYYALHQMSAVKKLAFADTVIGYIDGKIETADLPPELMPAPKPKATAPAKKAAKKSAKKAAKKAASKKPARKAANK